METQTLTIVIELADHDSYGGYRAVIDDLFTHPGYGDTPSEAAEAAIDACREWIDAEEPNDTD